MNIGSTFLGRNVNQFKKGDSILPVTRVIINYGTDENGATLSKYAPTSGEAGSGRTLEKTVQTITSGDEAQKIATALLAQFANDNYKSVIVSGCELDPAAELGDAVTANGLYTAIGQIDSDFTKSFYVNLQAQGQPEDDDFPYLSSVLTKAERDILTMKASIKVTANEIRSEVSGWTGIDVVYWESTEAYDTDDVVYLDGAYYKSKVDNNIGHEPPNATYWDLYTEEMRTQSYVSSAITQSASSIKAEVYGTYAELYSSSAKYYVSDVVKYTVNNVTHFYKCIDVDDEYIQGIVPTNTDYWDDLGTSVTIQSLISMNLEGISISYSSSASDNSAYIKLNKDGVEIGGGTITMGNVVAESVSASWVYAGSIVGTQITADTLSVSQLSCKGTSDKITVKNADGTSTYGYIGCGTGSDGSSTTTGVFVGANATHYLIPTTQGVRMQSGSNKFYISNDYTVFGSVCYGTLANRPAGTEGAIYFVVS